MDVVMTLDGLDKVEEHFAAFEHNIGSSLTMAEIGKEIDAATKKGWGRGIQDETETLERWGDHKPLVLSGSLRDSMKILEVTRTSVTYGTDLFYGRMLQDGTKNMRKKRVIRLPRKAIKAMLAKAIMRGTGDMGEPI